MNANTDPSGTAAAVDRTYGNIFNADYYRNHCGPVPYTRSEPQWAMVFGAVADHLIHSFHPKKVLDVGCALGFLVEAFRDRGVEAWGIDISQYAIANVRSDMAPYCRVGSVGAEVTGGPYDLITCIEVLEHMPEAEATTAIGRMAESTDNILFSSTPCDFDEPTHVNVQSIPYWIHSFENHGFAPDLEFDASFVVSHAILFCRSERKLPQDVVKAYETLLRARQQIVDRDNRINELTRDINQAQTKVSTLAAEIQARDTTIAELTSQSDRQSQRISDLELELAGARHEVDTANAKLQALHVQISNLLNRTRDLEQDLLSARMAQERSEKAHEQIRDDLEAATREVAACLSSDKVVLDADELKTVSDHLLVLESRLKTIEDRMVDVAMGLDAITQSKTWRTLVKGAGIALKLIPGIGRR